MSFARPVLAAALVLSVLSLLASETARAQVQITVDPVMLRGAAGAPVTILEFSDYQ